MRNIGYLIFLILFTGIGYAQEINRSYTKKNSPGKNLQLAINYLEKNNDEMALRHLNACLSKRYNFEDALFLRARIFNNKNQLPKALIDYNALINLNNSKREYYFNRGFVRYNLEQYELALEDLYMSLQLPNDDTQTVFYKIETGIDGISGISTLNGMDADTWNCIGLCHHALNQISKAVESFSKGIEIDPASPDLYINRALAHEKCGDIELAFTDYEYVLSIFPEHPIARYNLINLQVDQEPEDLLISLNMFIEKNSSLAQGYASRGLYYFNTGDYKSALNDFQKAAKLDVYNTDYLFNLALIHEKLNQLEDAEQYFDMIIELDDNHAGAYFNLGNIQFKKGAYQNAVSLFTLAHHLDKNNPYILYNRAITKYNLGMKDEACTDIELVRILDKELGKKFYNKNCSDN